MTELPTLVLLPGMDGTGRLFDPLIRVLPAGWRARVVSFPPDEELGYAGLERFARRCIPARGPYVLVGESFSGPLAIRLAATADDRLAGLVLASSFARDPSPRALGGLRRLVHERMFRTAPSLFAIRLFLTGGGGPRGLAREVRKAIRSVEPSVLAHRLRALLTVDSSDDLQRVAAPILCLGGSRDRLLGHRAGRTLRESRPDATHAVLSAPHLVLQGRPRESVEAIQGLLA